MKTKIKMEVINMTNHKISNYENQYMKALIDIYKNGFEDGKNERTGHNTKRLPGIVFRVDVEKEFPILKTKFVAGKTALREILWIWQKQSNNIHDLNASIWDEWSDKNGSIGKAYGAQMKKPINIYADIVRKDEFRSYENQAKYIIEYLREFPNGRWAVATLWNPSELSQMALVPCCHTSTWNLDGGRLNCVLDQRSGDMPYGVPFNTTQYAELMCLIARDLGVNPGILTHVIADAHIYDNQMEGVAKQIENYQALQRAEQACVDDNIVSGNLLEILRCEPRFICNSSNTDFFSINDSDCLIKDYKHMGNISFGEVIV